MMNISRRTELRVTREKVGLSLGPVYATVNGIDCHEEEIPFDDVPIAAPPLYRAAENGQLGMIEWLLAHGAEPDALASDGTSPLAVVTVVGFLDLLKVSSACELKSFLLSMCIEDPEPTAIIRFSVLLETSPTPLCPQDIFRHIPRCFADAIFLS